MFVTSLKLFGSRAYPLALSAIYNEIAEFYALPSLQTLIRSVTNEVVWPDTAPRLLQVYYLENMLEDSPKHVFQIRFQASRDAREHVAVFASIFESQICNLAVDFPGRTGRTAFSHVLGHVKSVCHRLDMTANDLQIEVSGFSETGYSKYIREHSLSAFVWIEGISRYLHVKEDPSRIDGVQKGRIQL